MADDTAIIFFNNDTITDPSAGSADLNGSISVDYTTGAVSGNYVVRGQGAFNAFRANRSIAISNGLSKAGDEYMISDGTLTLSFKTERQNLADTISYVDPGTNIAGIGVVGAVNYSGTNQSLSTDPVHIACYVNGTSIATPDGDRLV